MENNKLSTLTASNEASGITTHSVGEKPTEAKEMPLEANSDKDTDTAYKDFKSKEEIINVVKLGCKKEILGKGKTPSYDEFYKVVDKVLRSVDPKKWNIEKLIKDIIESIQKSKEWYAEKFINAVIKDSNEPKAKSDSDEEKPNVQNEESAATAASTSSESVKLSTLTASNEASGITTHSVEEKPTEAKQIPLEAKPNKGTEDAKKTTSAVFRYMSVGGYANQMQSNNLEDFDGIPRQFIYDTVERRCLS